MTSEFTVAVMFLLICATSHAQPPATNAVDAQAAIGAKEAEAIEEITTITKEIEASDKDGEAKRKRLLTLERSYANVLAKIRDEIGPSGWGYQLVKPSTRIYFDVGGDDSGEVDLFKDGKLGIAMEFSTLFYDWKHRGISFGPYLGLGISSASGESTSDAAVLIVSGGFAVEFKEAPFGFEFGLIHGLSAGESLHGGSRDDTALYAGLSLTKLVKKVGF